MKFKESKLAHEYLDGLKGVEIGGSAHNGFGLNTKNIDVTDSVDTVYKKYEQDVCGNSLSVDIVAPGDDLPLESNSVDFVISSHVLEHFYDPIKALKEWYRVIRDGGYIYMIVPHKERTFDKERQRTTLEELIKRHTSDSDEENCDLSNDKVRSDMHFSVWITEDLVELVKYLGWQIVEIQDIDDKVGNGFAMVIKKNKKKNIFLYSTMPTSGCYYYRGDVFLRYSKKFNVSSNIDFIKGAYHSEKYIAKRMHEANVVIFLRPKDIKYMAMFKVLKMSGKYVLVDNDDDFSTIDKDNPAFHLVGSHSKTNQLFVNVADGVISSTETLDTKLKKYNENTAQVQNFIDFNEISQLNNLTTKSSNNEIRIGITGSAATLENTKKFIDILKSIKEKYNNIKFIFFSDKQSIDRIKKLFSENNEFIEAVTFQKYSKKLKSLNLDIALIPRKNNEFNRHKSNCKFLEYATLGIVVIAQGFETKDGPYDKSIENKVNGMLVYSNAEWISSVEYLLNKEKREEIAKNARQFVKKEFDIKDNFNKWEEAIDKLIDKSKVNKKESKHFSLGYYEYIVKQISNLKRDQWLKDKNNQIKKRDQWLKNKNNQIKERNEWLKDKNNQIKERNEWLKNKNEQIKRKNEQLQWLKDSKSFKLGNLFFRSVKKPYKLITFPYNFVKVILEKRSL